MKIAIMAGGTGGHIFPGIAVAKELKSMGHEIIWLGAKGGMEERIVNEHQFPLELLEIKGLRGKGMTGLIAMPFRLIRATFKAMKIFKNENVDVVLSMGGYVAGPGGLAAKLKRIPVVVHEQNSKFGMTNKYLSKWSKAVLTGFNLHGVNNSRHVGNPVRNDIESVTRRKMTETLHILVIGGSLGAQSMNQILPEVFKKLSKKFKFQVLHQCGKNKLKDTMNHYQDCEYAKVTEFIDDMSQAYANADLIIARAGALTIAEINAIGLAALYIPYPYAVDDHQSSNAKNSVDNGAALVWQEKDSLQDLENKLESLISHPARLEYMSGKAKGLHLHHAAKTVAEICLEVAQ